MTKIPSRSRSKSKAPYPHTPDARYFVVRGRLWRLSNPNLSAVRRGALVRRLMKARAALRQASAGERALICARIDRVKRALGERGKPWWKDGAPDYNRRLVKNTPYAVWFMRRATSRE